MFLRILCFFLFTPILLAETNDAIELFNGKDLSGWVIEGPSEFENKGNKEPIWVAENGMITCRVNNRKSYGFLRYDKNQFADFVFSLEYRLSEK